MVFFTKGTVKKYGRLCQLSRTYPKSLLHLKNREKKHNTLVLDFHWLQFEHNILESRIL